MKSDIVIIGAGVVGMAIALKCKKKFPHKSVTVLERNAKYFSETSRYNSAVIHSGIHQDPSFFRSKLARRGGPELRTFCEAHGVGIRKS